MVRKLARLVRELPLGEAGGTTAWGVGWSAPLSALLTKHSLVTTAVVDSTGGGALSHGADATKTASFPGRLKVVLNIVGLHIQCDEAILDQVFNGLKRLLACKQEERGGCKWVFMWS